jgi:serine/threonine-protein kinase
MADALERALAPATMRQVREWVESVADDRLRERARRVALVESRSDVGVADVPRTISQESGVDASEPSRTMEAPTLTSARPPPPRRRWALLAAAGALAVVVPLALQVRRHHGDPAAAASVVAAAPPTASDEAPTASSVPTAPPSALPSPLPPTPRASPANPRVRAQRSAPPLADCNPPYSLDAQGIRHPKPQCL